MSKYSLQEQITINRAIEILDKHATYGEEAFTNAEKASKYFRLLIGGSSIEKFCVAFLNNKYKKIDQMFFNGCISSAFVYPRQIAKRALMSDASAVIMAHNHPSGECTPSESDILITKNIVDALNLFKIRSLDHIIVSANDYLSLKERGHVDY